MPARRKSYEELELNGSFKKNPNRRPTGKIPKSEFPVGNAPHYFLPDEVICWNEFCRTITPGVLTATDRWIVEVASRLMAKFRDRSQGLSAAELARLVNVLSLIGASPVDRVRLAIAPAEEANNSFAEFIN